ncbi:DUF4189 domain-containing protein [Nocardia sp. NPDC052566]|uniref:DUF4189 domain-containing protein n=1 Tax=Nocardia sp. NPDC052566 TaxID=3364330 RepID=UPI0037CBEFDB
MSVSGKKALGLAVSSTAAIVAMGAGTANADRGPDGALYGSLAIAVPVDSTYYGSGWNYPNWAESDAAALAECGRSDCTIAVRFVNGCGAIAESADQNRYVGAFGANRAEAERKALDELNKGKSPMPFSGSAGGGGDRGRISLWKCTAGSD